MKILIVTQYFWPESFRINDLALTLDKKGHEITVLTGQPNYPEGHFFSGYGICKNIKQLYHKVKIIRVPIIPRGTGNGVRLALNYFSFVLSASILGPVLCRSEFDIILVYEPSPVTVGLPAVLFKRIKRAPIIFWVQDLWPETLSAVGAIKNKTLLNLVGILVRYIYSQCDRILIQSRSFRSSIERYGVDPEKIFYFPNSAEELYQPIMLEPDALEHRIVPSGFCVMFAGNIGAAQDFGTIIDAAELIKEYKDIHWVILGDGRLRSWVILEIDRRGLGDTVHLLGKHSVETMPRYFSLADVLLVTLKKDPIFALTIPSKLQSYLACGKPIIAALEGEGYQIVEESGAGLVCMPEDPESLASSVLKMYHMPAERRKKMGVRGRKYFENQFESAKLVESLEKCMRYLVETR